MVWLAGMKTRWDQILPESAALRGRMSTEAGAVEENTTPTSQPPLLSAPVSQTAVVFTGLVRTAPMPRVGFAPPDGHWPIGQPRGRTRMEAAEPASFVTLAVSVSRLTAKATWAPAM